MAMSKFRSRAALFGAVLPFSVTAFVACGDNSGSPADSVGSDQEAVVVASSADCRVELTKVNYDNPSTDTANVIELHVVRTSATAATTLGDCDLSKLVHVSGTNPRSCSVAWTVDLANVAIPNDDYVVICGHGSSITACDITTSTTGNLAADMLQNGDSDGLAFYDSTGAAVSDVVWEGINGCFTSPRQTEIQKEGNGSPDMVNIACGADYILADVGTAPLRKPNPCPVVPDAGAGGAATGGASTGGASTGGASTGGASTGGASTGGTSTGGAATGGTSTGGVGATGGTGTGGTGTGGTGTGGTGTGGATTGGTGGTSAGGSGGAATGGSGGTATGGSGGAATGGTSTGGSGGAATGGSGGAATGGSGGAATGGSGGTATGGSGGAATGGTGGAATGGSGGAATGGAATGGAAGTGGVGGAATGGVGGTATGGVGATGGVAGAGGAAGAATGGSGNGGSAGIGGNAVGGSAGSVSIGGAGGFVGDGGTIPDKPFKVPDDEGCSCSTPGQSSGGAPSGLGVVGVLGLALAGLRRRRQR